MNLPLCHHRDDYGRRPRRLGDEPLDRTQLGSLKEQTPPPRGVNLWTGPGSAVSIGIADG